MTEFTLITGASSGLGEDFAREYAKAGQNLILIARRIERLNALKRELEAAHKIEVRVVPLDLSDDLALDAFLKTLDPKIFIDRLINNAGFGLAGPFDALEDSRMREMIRVNIEAVNRLTYALIGPMKDQGRGEILNVASMAAFTAGPYMAEYYATKAYVLSFSLALHEELKPFGIKVSALCPGPTHTEFFKVAKSGPSFVHDRLTMASLPVVKKGMKDLHANRAISVPGWTNHGLRILAKLAPRTAAARIIAGVQKQRL